MTGVPFRHVLEWLTEDGYAFIGCPRKPDGVEIEAYDLARYRVFSKRGTDELPYVFELDENNDVTISDAKRILDHLDAGSS